MSIKRFPNSFFLRPTLEVAKALLGATLVTEHNGKKTGGVIVEVEAYGCGENDEACHAHRGKTKRTEVMFEDGGVGYVYFIYGVHYCVNVVTEKKGVGAAVLIRALEPTIGIDIMERRRKLKEKKNLTNGPGKLCGALGITRAHNGSCLRSSDKMYLIPAGEPVDEKLIIASKRIGISKAKDKLWRFCIKGNPFVSK